MYKNIRRKGHRPTLDTERRFFDLYRFHYFTTKVIVQCNILKLSDRLNVRERERSKLPRFKVFHSPVQPLRVYLSLTSTRNPWLLPEIVLCLGTRTSSFLYLRHCWTHTNLRLERDYSDIGVNCGRNGWPLWLRLLGRFDTTPEIRCLWHFIIYTQQTLYYLCTTKFAVTQTLLNQTSLYFDHGFLKTFYNLTWSVDT